MKQGPPAHYVRHNKVTRVPRNFIYFDSEAYRTPNSAGETQTFRLAVATHDRRRHDVDGWTVSDTETFDEPDLLWKWVDSRTQARARTVAVAHNLAYDVRITDALTQLPRLGWVLRTCAFQRGRAWFSWWRDGRTLIMIDSMSWLPVALERLGEMVEIPKLPLPAWDDSHEAWEARCRRDVDILQAACRQLWDWIREDDLGNWKPTGAGQSWAAYRHRFMEHRLLAHDDDDARVAERRAAWTGRCEVWRHGRPGGGPFTEWDISAAYARVGAECDVPTKLVGTSSHPTLEQWRKLTTKYALLAEVTVTTAVPTLPALVDGRICWPVGTFKTTVWENELALAIEHGAVVGVSRLWWYRRAPALSASCAWVLRLLGGSSRGASPVVVLAAKHWSRALVGRFGARWSEWTTVGRSDQDDLSLITVIDRTEDRTWTMLQVGKELKRESATFDAADSVVSVMSWVMAECRVRLWRLTELAGPENVCYMDTDGLIVTAAGTERLLEAAVPNLRRKETYPTCELLGPRQIILSGALRASGVPKRSVKVGADTWQGEVWSEIASDIRNGTPAEVHVTRRRIRIAGVDARRVHNDDGSTSPRSVELAP